MLRAARCKHKIQINMFGLWFLQLKCASSLDTAHGSISQLRAQATARLAKEEKDFTSTVVLSENNMFVLPNINGLGKRNKKKPKRYNECLLMDGTMDFVDLGDEAATNTTTTTDDNTTKAPVSYAGEMERIRHARVTLSKMTVLNHLEPLCMVHQLYRCFCQNSSITGEPFELTIDKKSSSPSEYEPEIPVQLDSVNQWESIPPRKRQYTFEKPLDGIANAKKRKMGAEAMTTMTAVNDGTEVAARTRPFGGRKFMTRQGWRTKRRYYESIEAPLLKSLLTIQRRCRAYSAVPMRPMPMFMEIIDDDESEVSANEPKQPSTHVPVSQSVRRLTTSASVTNPVDERHIQRFNQIVTSTMRTIRVSQAKSAVVLSDPSSKLLECKGWDTVIDAYQKEQIFVWLVQYDEEQSALLAITTINQMPMVPQASSVSNIRVTETSSLPLIGKMIKCGVVNETTKQLGMSIIT